MDFFKRDDWGVGVGWFCEFKELKYDGKFNSIFEQLHTIVIVPIRTTTEQNGGLPFVSGISWTLIRRNVLSCYISMNKYSMP